MVTMGMPDIVSNEEKLGRGLEDVLGRAADRQKSYNHSNQSNYSKFGLFELLITAHNLLAAN